MKLLVLALIASMILVIPTIHAYGTPKLTSWRDKGEKYKQYEIDLDVKINGHKVPMVLDTGSSITMLSGHSLKGLHLKPHSTLMKQNDEFAGVDGKPQKAKASDVTMSIAGSKPFKTSVNYMKGGDVDNALLSIHDFIKAFSGLQFKPNLQFVH